MGDVCILVPGIGGSELVADGRTVWDVSKRYFLRSLLTSGEPFARLTLEDRASRDGIVAGRPFSGITFIPGFWHHGRTLPLLSVLRRQFGPAHVLAFAYDWRHSVAASAALLAKAVDEALASRPEGTRMVLVAHSMGGLVARRYLACEGGAERCSLLVSVGTPYRGAVKALDVLAHGVRLLPAPARDRFLTFVRSLPSVYELLPSYDCFVERDGSRTGLSSGWPAVLASSELYDAACAVHAETERAVVGLGSDMPQPLVVVGQHQWTPTFARRRPDGDVVILTRGDVVPPAAPGSRGDGTVPRGSAQPPEWGEEVTRAHAVVGRHVDLPAAPSTLQALGAALRGREYMGLGTDTQDSLAVDIPDVVAGTEPVEVRATHPDDRLSLELWMADIHTGATVAHQALASLGDGEYRQLLPDVPPGAYEVAVTGLADGRPHRISDLLLKLPEGTG
ncbi:MAG: esterase/lipase family protein [Acidimicrobiales bacterium]